MTLNCCQFVLEKFHFGTPWSSGEVFICRQNNKDSVVRTYTPFKAVMNEHGAICFQLPADLLSKSTGSNSTGLFYLLELFIRNISWISLWFSLSKGSEKLKIPIIFGRLERVAVHVLAPSATALYIWSTVVWINGPSTTLENEKSTSLNKRKMESGKANAGRWNLTAKRLSLHVKAGRTRIRLLVGSYHDLVNWYCSLLTRPTVRGRAAGKTPRAQKPIEWNETRNCTNSVVVLQDHCSYKGPITNYHIKKLVISSAFAPRWEISNIVVSNAK